MEIGYYRKTGRLTILKTYSAQFILALLLSFAPSHPVFADTPSPLKTAGKLIEAEQHESALNVLNTVIEGQYPESIKALAHLSSGKVYFKLKRTAEGIAAVKESLRLGTRIADISHFYLGKLYLQNNNNNLALASFLETLRNKPNVFIQNEAYFHLGKTYFELKSYKNSRYYFRKLERRIRGKDRHPEVLWHLIQAENKLRRKWVACRWARKLYSKYPAHPLVYDWGIDLQANKIEGERTGCVASPKVQKSRIRRLQYSGESDRAMAEIKTLQSRVRKGTVYLVDSILANFLINDGNPHEALKILLKHYKKESRNKDYLMLLAKASSRSGEFQAAVGAYHKVHNLAPRSRSGRQALFKAAFLSYQFQDYDGAGRKFQEFTKKYRRSGLSRDSQWHLAWIKYLKKDFVGAEKAFADLLRQKKRWRRRWYKYSTEKIEYWRAMSLYRMERLTEARDIFARLAQDNLLGYYSVAASERLKVANQKIKALNIRDLAADKNSGSGNSDFGDLNKETVIAAENSTPASEEEESEESLLADQENGDEEETLAEINEVEALGENEAEEEVIVATNFRDPRLTRRFERARELAELGLNEWAYWELYEIERRTSNADYRKMLMAEYKKLGAFHRSAYIGGIYFSDTRKRYGYKGVRYLWEFTYPRAYENLVLNYSKSFSVPDTFVWSIMRAETHYKKTAISPVGAMGLMQIMPYTGRQLAKLLGVNGFAVKSLLEPEVNVRFGTRYLNRLLKLYQKIPLAAASYNAGPHRVHSWLSQFGELEMDEFIEHIPFLQTRNYVKKVVRFEYIYSLLYKSGKTSSSFLAQAVDVPVTGDKQTRENWESL